MHTFIKVQARGPFRCIHSAKFVFGGHSSWLSWHVLFPRQPRGQLWERHLWHWTKVDAHAVLSSNLHRGGHPPSTCVVGRFVKRNTAFASFRSTIPELSKLWVLLLALTEPSCGMLLFLGWSVSACLKPGTRAPWRLKHGSGTAFSAFVFDTHQSMDKA